MLKSKDWQLISELKPQVGVDIKILRKSEGYGFLYLTITNCKGECKVETSFSPNFESIKNLIIKNLPQIFVDSERKIDSIRKDNFQKGDYSPGIVDDWYSRENKPDIPDHLPPGI